MADPDRTILRDLAARYAEAAADPEQDRRRDLWRRHNSLRAVPPPIYVRAFAWRELPESACRCEDPFMRRHEAQLRMMLFR